MQSRTGHQELLKTFIKTRAGISEEDNFSTDLFKFLLYFRSTEFLWLNLIALFWTFLALNMASVAIYENISVPDAYR